MPLKVMQRQLETPTSVYEDPEVFDSTNLEIKRFQGTNRALENNGKHTL